MSSKEIKDRVANMSEWNGNIFAVMGNTQALLRGAKMPYEEISKIIEDCKNSHDYNEALGICMKALENAGYEIE